MIIREADDGLILIRQTEHARLCGLMASDWGASGFAAPAPLEPLVVAAREHDNGWKEWEDAPRLNRETNRPHTYIDIPIDQHLAIYRRGIARVLVHDPYAGVMVSLHGSLLYSRFRIDQAGAADFLSEQQAMRDRLIEQLAEDPRYADHCELETLMANRDLLFGWDALSLFLCHGEAWEKNLEFPTGRGPERTPVRVTQRDGRWQLDPFPFRAPLAISIATVALDGAPFESEGAMRQALRSAAPRVINVAIEPSE